MKIKLNTTPTTAEPPQFFNLAQAAELLHLSPTTLRKLVRNGEVPYKKAGRRFIFFRPALERWASGE